MKEEKTKYLILECRYYNGEDDNPFAHELDAHEIDKSHLPPPECMKDEYTLPPEEVISLKNSSTAWNYEQWYIENYPNPDKKSLFKDMVSEYCRIFGDFEPGDGTPVELKALLWNRYDHWASGTPDDFKEWYQTYYQVRATNRQRRAEERRKILIHRCKYYRGEKEFSGKSRVYQMFWDYEKHWVEALAYSFKNGEEWRKDFESAHLWLLAKRHDIPATLIGMLYNRYMHWGNGGETVESFQKWIEETYVRPAESTDHPLTMHEKQLLADKAAQDYESIFDFAMYLGESDGKSIFLACSNHAAVSGLPVFIIIDSAGHVETECSLTYADMLKEE